MGKVKIDSKGIEEKAINYLRNFIEDSELISQYITDNDKGPFWDGYFLLYSKGGKDKEHQLGRVPIQIKGTMVDHFPAKKWKFKLEKNDLKAYLHDPTIFFVCQIKKNSKEKKLFYRELLPETVKTFLKDMGKNASRMTVFHPLTENLKDFEQQLLVFMANSRKMISFADKEPLTMEQVAAKGITKFSFVAPIKDANNLKLFHYLSTHETYLYAKPLKEFDIEVPISSGPLRFTFMNRLDVDIKVGDRIFFHGCESKIENGKIIYMIGKVLTLNMPIDEKYKGQLDIKFTSKATTLDESILEAEFSIALYEEGVLSIGEAKLEVKVNEVEIIYSLKEKLEKWKRLRTLLKTLNVTKQIDLSGITEEQGRYLNVLTESILEDKTVNLPGQASTIILFEISNLNLLLWCLSDNNGKCKFGSFCDQNIGIGYDLEGERIMLSPYSYLQQKNLWEKCDNINYEEIIPSITKACEQHVFCYQIACHDILAIINASDKTKNNDKEKSDNLLNIADHLCQWQQDNDPYKENHDFHFINKMKIIKRLRDFSEFEIKELKSYLQSDGTSNLIKASIYQLLGEKTKYEDIFLLLSEDEQNELEQYPAWKFL